MDHMLEPGRITGLGGIDLTGIRKVTDAHLVTKCQPSLGLRRLSR